METIIEFPELLQGTDCKNLQLQHWGSQVQNEHQNSEEHTPPEVFILETTYQAQAAIGHTSF